MKKSAIILLFLVPAICFAADVRVVDGDTLKIDGEYIRLIDIDAPEIKQNCFDGTPCGIYAREALAKIIRNGVMCKGEKKDRYGRSLGDCIFARVGYGDSSVSEEMVRQGWAVKYHRSTNKKILDLQREAEIGRLGIYAHGGIEEPSVYRNESAK